jgi:hypothetical protein
VHLAQVVPLNPWAYRDKYGSIAIDVVVAVLRIVFNYKNHGVFPTWAMGNQLHSQPQGRIVILDEPWIGPGRPRLG